MADTKKFLDQQGTTYLYGKIKDQLDTKADASRVTTLEGKVTTLEANGYDDTNVKASIATNASDIDALETRMGTAETDIDTVEGKVTTLIGTDTNKSVRTIANEELAAQLIPTNAAEAMNTLQEIAAWIQAHPGDATAMNSAITALQNKLVLGINASTEQEYATVKAYVEAYVASLATNYATAAQGAKADTALQSADIVALTTPEIDAAIAAANQSSGN